MVASGVLKGLISRPNAIGFKGLTWAGAEPARAEAELSPSASRAADATPRKVLRSIEYPSTMERGDWVKCCFPTIYRLRNLNLGWRVPPAGPPFCPRGPFPQTTGIVVSPSQHG